MKIGDRVWWDYYAGYSKNELPMPVPAVITQLLAMGAVSIRTAHDGQSGSGTEFRTQHTSIANLHPRSEVGFECDR